MNTPNDPNVPQCPGCGSNHYPAIHGDGNEYWCDGSIYSMGDPIVDPVIDPSSIVIPDSFDYLEVE